MGDATACITRMCTPCVGAQPQRCHPLLRQHRNDDDERPRGRRATREISEIFGHIPRILGNRMEGNFGGIIPEFEEHN